MFEDNVFEHISGNAIWLGNWADSYPQEGLRACEVLVRRNQIVDCGKNSIICCSTYGLDGNIVIRDNFIEVPPGNGIALMGVAGECLLTGCVPVIRFCAGFQADCHGDSWGWGV